MPRDLTDDKSTLVQVMAWCRQATSHYLSQCWPSSMLPYSVTRPQWVKKISAVYNLVLTVTKFVTRGRGLQPLPHDTNFCNCREKIVESRVIFTWSNDQTDKSVARPVCLGSRYVGYHHVIQFFSAACTPSHLETYDLGWPFSFLQPHAHTLLTLTLVDFDLGWPWPWLTFIDLPKSCD